MKKVITALALITPFLCFSEERSSFIYGDAHALGAYPLIGAGMRTQQGIHAFDFSANVCLLNPPSSFSIFHIRGLYLAYPQQKGFYFGGGLGILNEPESVKISGSIESAIGYQWTNRIFLEANATVPFKQSQAIIPVYPGITLGIGF